MGLVPPGIRAPQYGVGGETGGNLIPFRAGGTVGTRCHHAGGLVNTPPRLSQSVCEGPENVPPNNWPKG